MEIEKINQGKKREEKHTCVVASTPVLTSSMLSSIIFSFSKFSAIISDFVSTVGTTGALDVDKAKL